MTQPTPQNLPALIKEMQQLAEDESLDAGSIYPDADVLSLSKANTLITDTANATLEYVKGVAEELKMELVSGDSGVNVTVKASYNQALTHPDVTNDK